MKKTIFILITLFLSKNIFAIDLPMSTGGGGLLGYTFTRYTLEGGGVNSTQKMDRIDYGGFLFFDATYGVASVIIKGGNNSFSEDMIVDVSSLGGTSGTGNELSLGFSLAGKYPLIINEKITWFPMLGIEYHIALIQRRSAGGLVYDRTDGIFMEDRDKNDKPYPLSVWNSWWINIGAGLDYNISDVLFLRGELLFGFRLPTRYELGALKVIEDKMNIKNPSLAGLTGSPSLKIGVGYRL